MRIKRYGIVTGGLQGGIANAGWFGDGRDGDLYVSAGEEYIIEVAADEGQIVKYYRNVYIGEGAIVRPSTRCNGMVFVVQNSFECNGHISVDRCAPLKNSHETTALAEPHIKQCGALKGGNSGLAGRTGVLRTTDYNVSYTPYSTSVAGIGFALGGGYGPGSSSMWQPGGAGEPRPPVGTPIPYIDTNYQSGVAALYGAGGSEQLRYDSQYEEEQGGAGPGGSAAVAVTYGDTHSEHRGNTGNAIGGGLFCLFVGGRLHISATGKISADGGNGANGVTAMAGSTSRVMSASGGGAGAGGGIIAIVHTGDFLNEGSIQAFGGKGGKVVGSPYTVGNDVAYHFADAGTDGYATDPLITTLNQLLAV